MTPLVLSLALTIAAPAPKKHDEEAPGKLDGEWVVESMEGPAPGPVPAGKLRFRFVDGKIHVADGMREKEEAAGYTIDTTKKLFTMDIRPENGPQGEMVQAIFEVKGDTLKLCFGRNKAERPTEFKGNAEKGVMLFVMKRVKPDK